LRAGAVLYFTFMARTGLMMWAGEIGGSREVNGEEGYKRRENSRGRRQALIADTSRGARAISRSISRVRSWIVLPCLLRGENA